MSEQPIRLAFCPLLYVRNGGKVNQKGKPVFEKGSLRRSIEIYVRGKCDEAFDCGECSILQQWINERKAEGFQVGWECVYCLKSVPGWTPGYYQSSKYRGPPGDWVEVEPSKTLDGCTRCGHGVSFLQLVLRK